MARAPRDRNTDRKATSMSPPAAPADRCPLASQPTRSRCPPYRMCRRAPGLYMYQQRPEPCRRYCWPGSCSAPDRGAQPGTIDPQPAGSSPQIRQTPMPQTSSLRDRKISRAFRIVPRNPRRWPGTSGRIPKLSHRPLPRKLLAVTFEPLAPVPSVIVTATTYKFLVFTIRHLVAVDVVRRQHIRTKPTNEAHIIRPCAAWDKSHPRSLHCRTEREVHLRFGFRCHEPFTGAGLCYLPAEVALSIRIPASGVMPSRYHAAPGVE